MVWLYKKIQETRADPQTIKEIHARETGKCIATSKIKYQCVHNQKTQHGTTKDSMADCLQAYMNPQ